MRATPLLCVAPRGVVALERASEVATHRLARRFRIAALDRLADPAMLFLDQAEVGAPAAHLLGQPAYRAPGNQVPADELQEARELRVAGRLGDGAVQRQILVDCVLAGGRGGVPGPERRGEGADVVRRGA